MNLEALTDINPWMFLVCYGAALFIAFLYWRLLFTFNEGLQKSNFVRFVVKPSYYVLVVAFVISLLSAIVMMNIKIIMG